MFFSRQIRNNNWLISNIIFILLLNKLIGTHCDELLTHPDILTMLFYTCVFDSQIISAEIARQLERVRNYWTRTQWVTVAFWNLFLLKHYHHHLELYSLAWAIMLLHIRWLSKKCVNLCTDNFFFHVIIKACSEYFLSIRQPLKMKISSHHIDFLTNKKIIHYHVINSV